MMAATDADALADAIPEEEIAVTSMTETVTGMMVVDAVTEIATETGTATEIVTETVTETGTTGAGAEMTARNQDPLSLIPVLPAGARIHASKIVRWQIPAVIAIIKKAGAHHFCGGSPFMHRDTICSLKRTRKLLLRGAHFAVKQGKSFLTRLREQSVMFDAAKYSQIHECYFYY